MCHAVEYDFIKSDATVQALNFGCDGFPPLPSNHSRERNSL